MATGYSEWISKGVLQHVITMNGAENSGRLDASNLLHKTVEMVATTSGGVMTIQGNNSTGTDWVTLTDPQGNALSATGRIMEGSIQENPRFIRARTSGGATTDAVTVRFLCR